MLFFLIMYDSSLAQDYIYTAGKENYWQLSDEGRLFDFFTSNFRDEVFSHRKAMRVLPLLVRLEDEDHKISKLRENGFDSKADELQSLLAKKNKELVSAFKKHYRNENYYFYYARDADKIFKEKDYSFLWKGVGTKAEGFEMGDGPGAYLLIYRQPVKNWETKEYVVHFWDLEKVSRVRRMEFISYNSWFSTKVNLDKTIKRLVRYIWDK